MSAILLIGGLLLLHVGTADGVHVNGTLLQSATQDDELFMESVRAELVELKLRESWAMYTQFTAAGILGEILDDNDVEATPSRVGAIRDRFIEGVRNHMARHGPFPEIPGARDFLHGLHASSTHRIAYATGGWGGSAHLKLSLAGFPVDGVPLASSDDHFERPKIMLHALSQLGGAYDTVTYYGDGHWDRVAAQALGWQFVPVGAKISGLTTYPKIA